VTVTVRTARAADADAFTAVFLASRAAALPWLPDLHTDAETRHFVEHQVLATGTTWLAVDPDGAVVGFAALHGSELEHLYLRPDRRREGIGRLLLDTVRRASPHGLTLYVFERNTAARAFYEAAGFRVLATGDGSGNEEGLPDLRYGWSPGTAAGPPG
jgi:ribosomal protein S18 acetylase RimI-like enzyme